jgi:O6-methylguanine-DNA--protein-cysteine methyltransferase
LLNDQWAIDEIKEKIKSLLEVNENENMTYQNLWDTTKAIPRGKFITISAYTKRTNKQPNATSQTPRKTRTSKIQIKHRERNNKNSS